MAGSGISSRPSSSRGPSFFIFRGKVHSDHRLGKPHLLHCGRDNFEGLGYVSLSRL